MVSIRCKMLVKDELKKLGLHFVVVELGEVDIMETLSEKQHAQLKKTLQHSGLALMDDKEAVLIENIKDAIVEMVHHANELPIVKNSDYLSKKLEDDYTYLATLFSEVTGTTIEHYTLAYKIERVKELILYGEFNLTEIAAQLRYSSVAHLSHQFKKVTGLTPSYFKKIKQKRLLTLKNV